jgi:hypothetical protein
LDREKGLSIPALADRPEVKLLLCCARSRTDPERTAEIGALLQERIDWKCLLRTARSQRIIPLVSWQLNTISSGTIPNGVVDQLTAYFRNNSFRSLSLARELLRFMKGFEAHGITAIPYKGPVLATSACGNLALRESTIWTSWSADRMF